MRYRIVASSRQGGRQPPSGRLQLFRVPREAQPEKSLASRAKRGSRSQPHSGFVDETEREPAGIRLAVDGEQQIERTHGNGEPATPGRGERAAHDVAAAAGTCNLMGDEAFTPLESGDRG